MTDHVLVKVLQVVDFDKRARPRVPRWHAAVGHNGGGYTFAQKKVLGPSVQDQC